MHRAIRYRVDKNSGGKIPREDQDSEGTDDYDRGIEIGSATQRTTVVRAADGRGANLSYSGRPERWLSWINKLERYPGC